MNKEPENKARSEIKRIGLLLYSINLKSVCLSADEKRFWLIHENERKYIIQEFPKKKGRSSFFIITLNIL